jgi:hypothetical protein
MGIVLFKEKKTIEHQKPSQPWWSRLPDPGAWLLQNEPISSWYHLCDGSAKGAVEGFWLKM